MTEQYEQLANELVQVNEALLHQPAQDLLSKLSRGEHFVLNYLLTHYGQAHPTDLSRHMVVSTARIAALLNRMEEKGLIRHEAGSKARVYHPALSRDETALAETRTLLDKAFDGSVGLLVNTLIQQNSLTQSDLDGLYEILRQAEEGEEGTK